jgi:hypothetical protein
MPTIQEQVMNSGQLLWDRLAMFLPNLIAAIILLILGWLVGNLVGQLIRKVLEAVQIDRLADRLGMDRLSGQVGRRLSLSGLGAWLVKWFVIIAAFVAATDILNMHQVSDFLYTQVIPYFGNVIVAVIILVIGVVAANFLSEVVRGAVRAAGLHVASAMAAITRWSILIFAILAALAQLRIAPTFLQTLFIGIVALIALAGGLAFGLGGQRHASKVLDDVERNLTSRD